MYALSASLVGFVGSRSGYGVAVSSLRESRREKLRAQIAQHALQLFAHEGFDAVTAERLAAELGISRRTFFGHFASKEDVVVHGANDDLHDLEAGLAAHTDLRFVDSLAASAPAWLESAGRHVERRRLRASVERDHPKVKAAVREARLQGLQRVARPHVAADLERTQEDSLVLLVTGAFAGIGLALDEVMLSEPAKSQQAVAQALDLLGGMMSVASS